ncbi:MAG: hypothetical protein AUK54_06650 [Helicobacteraceae bacterium CG2_30_36_10]|nr:MAG: hypothetical protein AUK54_06650 [Helicobacteraceae bacterium CG2_30_36_10]
MNKIILLLLPALLFAAYPVSVPKEGCVNISSFDTKSNSLNKQTSKNKKIRCRMVCDKKIYKEEKIADAISFYKNSKDYKFTK